MGEPQKLADGLVRLGTPMVNWYLVADQSGVTVLDTGLAGYRDQLEPGLELIGRSLDDVRAVVLTHGDADHTGVATKLRKERPDLPVYLHPADEELARRPMSKKTDGSMLATLAHPGLYRLIGHFGRNGALNPPKLEGTTSLAEGESVEVPGSPRIVPTPGHTPGHVALHFAQHGALFVGDAMCTWNPVRGKRGAQLMPRALNVSTPGARESLKQIEGIDAEFLLVGHGEPWTDGPGAAVAQAREAPLT